MSLPQPNGSCYAFGRDVNCEWKHGVLPLRAGEARPSRPSSRTDRTRLIPPPVLNGHVSSLLPY
jgi:hypothetical protein